ncbi:SWR1-complex protein 3 [Komagataella phaffii CBS 7435]|uniref:SWR1-complex protein 3 n=2 Tax=Komagataella phaffii TaxID=460519 RepID=C4QWJ1_KOMPG|nr:uncharacterized protein PAS_chr1-1_0244 [Komagataella phaffii GS115]CAH2446309.1 SWR1-complex protein 3 [Komagataella phaffii CBS 7435]CAY67614.1 Protein of unknown function, component of the SWR1 complex [Komagataella phaffii GS115]CCA36706.1 SWR1-complex protein 3 [Komagataella phaffii CBS 7435]
MPMAEEETKPRVTAKSITADGKEVLNSTVIIQPATTVDQKKLKGANAIYEGKKKPFKVVQSLPMSIDDTDVDYLRTPLSIKDSAVLYNSLVYSRFNWTHNIFKIFWRRKDHIVGGTDRKRDKMSKLCDCQFTAGPHQFQIRMFVLKDEEIERRFEQEQKEKRESKQKAKEEKERLKEERRKLRELQEKERVLGVTPTSAGVAGPAVGTSATTVPSNSAAPKVAPVPSAPTVVTPSVVQAKPETVLNSKPDESTASATHSTQHTPPQVSVSTPVEPTEPATTAPAASTAPTTAVRTTSSKQAPESSASGVSTPAKSATTPIPAVSSSVTSDPQTTNETKKPIVPKPKQTQADYMASPENQLMITNLNAIAKVDTSLNSLMKIVASGNASTAQIAEFHKYIQRAREMGDTNGTLQRLQQEQQRKQKEELMQRQQRKLEEQRQRLLEKEEKKRQRQLLKESKPERKESETLTAFQMRYSKDANLVFEFTENTSSRFFFPKNAIIEVIDDFEETPMQQATVKSEILEENQQTDKLPPMKAEFKDVTPLGDDNGTPTSAYTPNQTPKTPTVDPIPAKATTKKPIKRKSHYDLLLSFIVVHNQVQIDEWEANEKAKEEARIKLEKEESQRELEEEENEKKRASQDSGHRLRKRPKRKKSNWSGTRKTRNASLNIEPEVEEKKDETVKPVPIFSCVTIGINKVSAKFVPILKNSVNSREKTLEYMEGIKKAGTQLDKYHLWYELDAFKDELLSEQLRFNLNRLDFIQGGSKLKGKAMLRRIVETGGATELEIKSIRQNSEDDDSGDN